MFHFDKIRKEWWLPMAFRQRKTRNLFFLRKTEANAVKIIPTIFHLSSNCLYKCSWSGWGWGFQAGSRFLVSCDCLPVSSDIWTPALLQEMPRPTSINFSATRIIKRRSAPPPSVPPTISATRFPKGHATAASHPTPKLSGVSLSAQSWWGGRLEVLFYIFIKLKNNIEDSIKRFFKVRKIQ